MREINYKIFTIDELTEENKKNAIENYRNRYFEYLFDDVDAEIMIEDFLNDMEENGFDIDNKKIYYSLSNCQGDGLCIVGDITNNDIINILKKENETLISFVKFIDMFGNINHNSNYYYHYNTMNFNFENDVDYIGNATMINFLNEEKNFLNKVTEKNVENIVDELINNINEIVENYFKELAKEYEIEGYENIEYHYTEEYIYDICLNNDFEFLENGDLF